jgi:membrane-associated protease RseP (regulator of RpoE activity)
LTVKELSKIAHRIIAGRMRTETLSRFYGAPVFKQRKDRITHDDIGYIQRELFENGIISSFEKSGDTYYLKLVRAKGAPRSRSIIPNILLFILTILTTMVTGAMLIGYDPFASWSDLSMGASYSFALLSILLGHEMGHYLAARYYKVNVTLPYFIPFFVPFMFHPGTMGAFIKMRSSIPDKKALFDIGIAGPLISFILSTAFLIWGFSHLPDKQGVLDYISSIHPLDNKDGLNLVLGNTLIFDWLSSAFGIKHLPMNEVYHFPYIFAGWFGLMVTALNLMPIGQLDGGHITFSLFGDKARLIAIGTFIIFILLNVYLISNFHSFIWILWIFLILIFIRFRHPPTLDDSIKIDLKRKILGYFAYIIFIISFSPLPFHIY